MPGLEPTPGLLPGFEPGIKPVRSSRRSMSWLYPRVPINQFPSVFPTVTVFRQDAADTGHAWDSGENLKCMSVVNGVVNLCPKAVKDAGAHIHQGSGCYGGSGAGVFGAD